jgi:hypothetical protein
VIVFVNWGVEQVNTSLALSGANSSKLSRSATLPEVPPNRLPPHLKTWLAKTALPTEHADDDDEYAGHNNRGTPGAGAHCQCQCDIGSCPNQQRRCSALRASLFIECSCSLAILLRGLH